MKKIWFIFCFAFFANIGFAQTPPTPVPGRLQVWNRAVNANTIGEYDAVVFLPANYNDASIQSFPLIVSFYGLGGSVMPAAHDVPGGNREGFIKQVWDGAALQSTFPAIVIAPEARRKGVSGGNIWWTPEVAKRLIEDAILYYKVDPDRVVITGLSAGGGAVMTLGEKYPYIFAGVMPIAIAPPKLPNVCMYLDSPLWSHGNRDDGIFGYWDWEASGAASFKAKIQACPGYTGSFTLTTNATGGHGGWDTQWAKPEVRTWLVSQVRNSSPPSNSAPVSNAGLDSSITLPTNTLTLSGSGTDPDGDSLAFTWTKISGGNATFTSPNSAITNVTNLVQGAYVFRLTANDNKVGVHVDEVTIIVNPAPVVVTGCGAGSGTIVREHFANITGTSVASVPAAQEGVKSNLTSLEGPSSIGDNYGARVRGYYCAPYSGSYTFSISSDDSSQLFLSSDSDPSKKVKIAEVNGWTNARTFNKYPAQKSAAITLVAGTKYYLEILHKEGTGGDHFSVKVQMPNGAEEIPVAGVRLYPFVQAVNIAPVVNAGADVSIVASPTPLVLTAVATDADGTISQYQWAQVSGAAVSMTNVTTASVTLSGLAAGVYVFKIVVTDNQGAQSEDSIQVTVTNPGGALSNRALNRPTSASSIYSAQFGSKFAVDGKADASDFTRFASGPGTNGTNSNHFLEIDLQAAYSLEQVIIDHGRWNQNQMVDFEIFVKVNSADALTSVAKVTGNGSMRTIHAFSPIQGRFVRIVSTKNVDDTMRVKEVEVLGR